MPAFTCLSLLRASPASLAPAVFAGPALVSGEANIQRLYREWETSTDIAHDRNLSDAETAVIDADRLPIASGIKAEPATDLRDLTIKILVNSGEGRFRPNNVLTRECAGIAGCDFDKLPRCHFEN